MDDGWVPFGPRNGFGGERFPDLGHLAWRHTEKPHEGCAVDQRRRCVCPGYSSSGPCCGAASQEDHLCDGCREHCHAVDSDGVYHRFIDLVAP